MTNRFLERLFAVGTALTLLAIAALCCAQKQTNVGPITSPHINENYFVGTQPYTTIQGAVSAACAGGAGTGRVTISFGVTPPDTIPALTGCNGVVVTDARTAVPQNYSWNGTAYAFQSTAVCQTSNGVVTITDCGAVGDGATDASAAIALAATRANLVGGTVLVPPGNYIVNVEQNSPPGDRAILYLPGLNNVRFLGTGSASRIFSTTLNKSTIEVINGANVTFTNLRVDAQNGTYVEHDGYSGGSAIKCSNMRHCVVDHVELSGGSAGAVYFTNGTILSALTDSYIHNTSSIGFNEDDCSAVSATTCAPSSPPISNIIARNVFYDSGITQGYGSITLDDGNNRTGTSVLDNQIYFTTATTNTQMAGINMNNVLDVFVQGNVITRPPGNCISTTNTFSGTINGNLGIACGQIGLDYYQQSGTVYYFHANGNSFEFPGQEGIRIGSTGATSGSITDVQISNTYIDVASAAGSGIYDGIYVQFGTHVAVTGLVLNGGANITNNGVHIGSTVVDAHVGSIVSHNIAGANIQDDSTAATAPPSAPFSDPSIVNGMNVSGQSIFRGLSGQTTAFFYPGDNLNTTKELYGTNATNTGYVWWINDDGSANVQQLGILTLHSTSGVRYLCIDVNGQIVSQATACSGT